MRDCHRLYTHQSFTTHLPIVAWAFFSLFGMIAQTGQSNMCTAYDPTLRRSFAKCGNFVLLGLISRWRPVTFYLGAHSVGLKRILLTEVIFLDVCGSRTQLPYATIFASLSISRSYAYMSSLVANLICAILRLWCDILDHLSESCDCRAPSGVAPSLFTSSLANCSRFQNLSKRSP